MGNLLNSEDSVMKSCCNFTDDTSYDDQEETYKIALKEDMNDRRDSKTRRTQTPYSITPDVADDPEMNPQTSFSFASAIDDD